MKARFSTRHALPFPRLFFRSGPPHRIQRFARRIRRFFFLDTFLFNCGAQLPNPLFPSLYLTSPEWPYQLGLSVCRFYCGLSSRIVRIHSGVLAFPSPVPFLVIDPSVSTDRERHIVDRYLATTDFLLNFFRLVSDVPTCPNRDLRFPVRFWKSIVLQLPSRLFVLLAPLFGSSDPN